MNFAWTPDLVTGNVFIDDQHKLLFAAATELFKACQIDAEKQEVERTMQFLLDYTNIHFADEETLQKKYAYPDYPAHKKLHDEFKGVARELAKKLSQDGPTDDLISEIYIAIGEWLISHLRGEDVKLVAYLKD